MKTKTFVALACTGLAIHGTLTWVLLKEVRKNTAEVAAKKKAWEECRDALAQIFERQKNTTSFWTQVKADFPEDMWGV